MHQIREKKHRLSRECYKGRQIVSFTCCIHQRQRFFADRKIVQHFASCLLDEASKDVCDVLVYIFMPDHCHILLEGRSESSDVMRVMIAFKRKTGFWLSRNFPDVRWQKDFCDHIIRSSKDLRRQIDYILTNPVRNNLVGDWHNYPFKGSSIHDFDKE